MTQFAPGESKTAIAPITVLPAGLSCEAEIFLGPDEMTKVVTSGLIPFTSTGASQDVHLPVVMPVTEGTYHVFIDVYAEGLLIAAYKATEDVVIVLPAVPWEYSNMSCPVVPSGVGAWMGVAYSATITNVGALTVQRTVTLWQRTYVYPFQLAGVWYGGEWYEWRPMRSQQVTLAPGQSFVYVEDPEYMLISYGSKNEIYLLDSAGYQSGICVADNP